MLAYLSLHIAFDLAMRFEITSSHRSPSCLMYKIQQFCFPNGELCAGLKSRRGTLNTSNIALEPVLSSWITSCWISSIFVAMSSLPLWRFSNNVERTANIDDVRVEASRASSISIIAYGFSPWCIHTLNGESPRDAKLMFFAFILTSDGQFSSWNYVQNPFSFNIVTRWNFHSAQVSFGLLRNFCNSSSLLAFFWVILNASVERIERLIRVSWNKKGAQKNCYNSRDSGWWWMSGASSYCTGKG